MGPTTSCHVDDLGAIKLMLPFLPVLPVEEVCDSPWLAENRIYGTQPSDERVFGADGSDQRLPPIRGHDRCNDWFGKVAQSAPVSDGLVHMRHRVVEVTVIEYASFDRGERRMGAGGRRFVDNERRAAPAAVGFRPIKRPHTWASGAMPVSPNSRRLARWAGVWRRGLS